MLLKDEFKEIIESIQKQEKINDTITEALNPICEGNGFFYDGGRLYRSALIIALKAALDLKDKDIIEWWLYEDVDKIIYINDKAISVVSIDDFYDYLIKYERKSNNE